MAGVDPRLIKTRESTVLTPLIRERGAQNKGPSFATSGEPIRCAAKYSSRVGHAIRTHPVSPKTRLKVAKPRSGWLSALRLRFLGGVFWGACFGALQSPKADQAGPQTPKHGPWVRPDTAWPPPAPFTACIIRSLRNMFACAMQMRNEVHDQGL